MEEYEHPVITNMERWGTPDGKEVIEPRCPICKGHSMVYMVRDIDGKIAGCSECVTRIDPWDCPECFEGR